MLNRNDVLSVVLDAMSYCHNTSCTECAHRVEGTVRACISNHITDCLMEMGFEVKSSKGVVTLTSNDIHELDRAIGGLAVIGEIIAASNAESISGAMNQALDILKGIVSRGDV